jgi:predicted DNA-binding mobile mystery protein A
MKTLQLQHLDAKMQEIKKLQQVAPPPVGWLKAIRTALGMSLQQVSQRLSVTRQSVQEMEHREQEGTITLKSLREAGKAMDMQLVYGFVPVDSSLEALIDRKARDLAMQIVLRTSHSMKLEDQENSEQRIEKAIQERAAAIKQEMPKALWN